MSDFVDRFKPDRMDLQTAGVRATLYKKLLPGFAKQNGLQFRINRDEDSYVSISLINPKASVTEALTSSLPFQKRAGDVLVNYDFEYQGQEFRVGFKRTYDAWNVVFVNKNQDVPFEPTGLGGGIPVLSTVMAIVKDFAQTTPTATAIRFSGENHNGLADLYRQIVRTMSKRLGLRYEEDRLRGQTQFLVHLRKTVTEAFDTTPAQFTLYSMEPSEAFYYFTANDMEFEVEFSFEDRDDSGMRLSQPYWKILYGPSDRGESKWGPTGAGGAGEILSTVIAIIQDFIKRKPKIQVFQFTASGGSHVRLYSTMVPYLANRLNFDYTKRESEYGGYEWLVYPHVPLHETVQYSDAMLEQLFAAIYRDRTFARETSTPIDEFAQRLEDEYIDYVPPMVWWEPGHPDITSTPEWWDGFKVWLEKRYRYVVRNIQAEIGGYPAQVMREMNVTARWNPAKHGLGLYWATPGADIHAFSGKEGPEYQTVHLTAEIQESDINWFDTIRSRLDFFNGDEEQEIQLKPGAMIKLLEIDDTLYTHGSQGFRLNVQPGVYPSSTNTTAYESLSSVQTHTPKQIAIKHGVDVSVISKQLTKGIAVEHEHTTSPSEARQIALDHLWELPDYYDRLGSMERQAGLTEGPAVPLRVTPTMVRRAADNKCQIIVEIPIQQFLNMTTWDQESRDIIMKKSHSVIDYNRWAKMGDNSDTAKRFNAMWQRRHEEETDDPYERVYGNDLMPWLTIYLDDDGSMGRIMGHEGRHRGSAAMRAGAKTMQVALRIHAGKNMFPDQYSPDYFITQEHLPKYVIGQFDKDVYPTGGWKILEGDLQKRTRERFSK